MFVDAATNAARPTAQIKLHGPAGFEGMRAAGGLAAECLDMLVPEVKGGVTTERLDTLAREFVMDRGALPACVFYRGYRHTVCTSLNHVVCHGIPGPRVLRDGDILNIDVTVVVNGWHGDTSRMYAIGDVKKRDMRLMDVTYAAMMKGIEAVRPGATLGDIGAEIQRHAEAERFAIVRDFCGHGLGQVFHDPPNILHYGRAGEGVALRPGRFVTIEPMVNAGGTAVKVLNDGWTAVTKDKQPSAQFEHAIGVTDTGVEIFTASPKGLHQPHQTPG